MKNVWEKGIPAYRKRNRVHYLICCIVVLLSVFVAACGAGVSNNGDVSEDGNGIQDTDISGDGSIPSDSTPVAPRAEWVYVPERIEVPDISADYNAMRLLGDTVCYISVSGEAEGMLGDSGNAEDAAPNICRYSLADRELTSIPIGWKDDGDVRVVSSYTFEENGNVWLIVNSYPADFSRFSRFLYKYDPEGKNIFFREITQEVESGYIIGMAADGEGRIYVFTPETGIWLYSGDGSHCGVISYDSQEKIQFMGTVGGEDGRFYVCLSKGDKADRCALAEVDFEGKRLVEFIDDFPVVNGICADSTGKYDCLLYDDTAAYGYDFATRKKEELFVWQDGDINGYFVQYISVLRDGRYFCTVNDLTYDDRAIVLLTRTRSDEVPGRLELVLAAVDGGSGLAAQTVAFNRNNSQYHITVKNYESLTELYNAILTRKPIDLIDLSGVSVKNLVRQGALEDIAPYLEQSKAFTRSDFLDGILEAYTFDDILVGIPESFSLRTVVGDGGMLENDVGLTLEECLAIAENHPGAIPFDDITREEMIQYLMIFNEDAFIDWETGECCFDSAQFKAVLEFVSRFPDSIEGVEEDVPLAVKIKNGDVLFAVADMRGVKNFQRYEPMFGEKTACVGFPTTDGKGGTLLFAGNVFGIAANSTNKSGAWDFIENILKRKNTDGMSGEEIYHAYYDYEPKQFPTLKRAMSAITDYQVEKDKADGKEYDIYIGELHFNSHPVTKEEIDIMMDLVPDATPFFSAEDDAVIRIIQEEADAYFSGQKTVEDVAGIIQNRVQVYVNENR